MKLFKRQTDDELVETIRKGLKWSKRFLWIYFISLVVMIYLIADIFRFFIEFVPDMPNEDYRKNAWSGLLYGSIMGILLSMFIYNAVQLAMAGIRMLRGNRSDQLLVKYHDILKEGETQPGCAQQVGQAFAGDEDV